MLIPTEDCSVIVLLRRYTTGVAISVPDANNVIVAFNGAILTACTVTELPNRIAELKYPLDTELTLTAPVIQEYVLNPATDRTLLDTDALILICVKSALDATVDVVAEIEKLIPELKYPLATDVADPIEGAKLDSVDKFDVVTETVVTVEEIGISVASKLIALVNTTVVKAKFIPVVKLAAVLTVPTEYAEQEMPEVKLLVDTVVDTPATAHTILEVRLLSEVLTDVVLLKNPLAIKSAAPELLTEVTDAVRIILDLRVLLEVLTEVTDTVRTILVKSAALELLTEVMDDASTALLLLLGTVLNGIVDNAEKPSIALYGYVPVGYAMGFTESTPTTWAFISARNALRYSIHAITDGSVAVVSPNVIDS